MLLKEDILILSNSQEIFKKYLDKKLKKSRK